MPRKYYDPATGTWRVEGEEYVKPLRRFNKPSTRSPTYGTGRTKKPRTRLGAMAERNRKKRAEARKEILEEIKELHPELHEKLTRDKEFSKKVPNHRLEEYIERLHSSIEAEEIGIQRHDPNREWNIFQREKILNQKEIDALDEQNRIKAEEEARKNPRKTGGAVPDKGPAMETYDPEAVKKVAESEATVRTAQEATPDTSVTHKEMSEKNKKKAAEIKARLKNRWESGHPLVHLTEKDIQDIKDIRRLDPKWYGDTRHISDKVHKNWKNLLDAYNSELDQIVHVVHPGVKGAAGNTEFLAYFTLNL